MDRTDRPRILVTVRRASAAADAATIDRYTRSARYYADAVSEAGGEPITLAAGDPIPDAFNGLLLSGGADVHRRHYGQRINESVRKTLSIDEARDAMELSLARRALEADRPILCICRGIQMLNVTAGGTLWQDISLAAIDPAAHFQDGRLESWEIGHEVLLNAASLLADVVGEDRIGVNTYHHQAVANPAPGFRIVARAPDGTVEGLESTHHRFAVGVQWHPERMVARHPLHRRLFERFVDAARGG